MKKLELDTKKRITFIWLIIIMGVFYIYFFKNYLILDSIEKIRELPIIWLCVTYLLLVCFRGIIFLPVTYLVLLSLVFLPPIPAYILTMIGVTISSLSIYYFSEYLSLADYFKKNYPEAIEKVTSLLQRNQLPIVIAWSFFPFTPTDVMSYVCGSLKMNVKKFILGIIIGKGMVVGIYIFIGKDILGFIKNTLF